MCEFIASDFATCQYKKLGAEVICLIKMTHDIVFNTEMCEFFASDFATCQYKKLGAEVLFLI